MKQKQYIIEKANGREELIEKVNERLSEGWICQGGPIVSGNLVSQALVKEFKEEIVPVRPNA